jgi:hypothetical protein
MRLLESVRRLATLHERAKSGTLAAQEAEEYRTASDELVRLLVAGQQITLQPGQKLRRVLRATFSVSVELAFAARSEHARTLDISAAGFAVLRSEGPGVGEICGVTLHLPSRDLQAQARVMNVHRLPAGSLRVGFQFTAMEESQAEILEAFVFDVVLRQFDVL